MVERREEAHVICQTHQERNYPSAADSDTPCLGQLERGLVTDAGGAVQVKP